MITFIVTIFIATDICSCGSNLKADWWQHSAACDCLITESWTGHVWSCETEESVVSHVQSLCAYLRTNRLSVQYPAKISCSIVLPELCIEKMCRHTGRSLARSHDTRMEISVLLHSFKSLINA